MATTRSLPVLMYHRVRGKREPISVSPEHFAAHCALLKRRGWRTPGPDEVEAYFLRGRALPARSVCITFDDGFLDNFTVAAPILREHGMCAVLFAVSGRIEDTGIVRGPEAAVDESISTVADGRSVRHDPFCDWAELRELQAAGTFSVQAHGTRHARVFSGPEYKGFFHPGLAQKRALGQFDPDVAPAPYGLPRFADGPALATRAYVPSAELLERVRESVPQDEAGAREFFSRPEALAECERIVAELPRERWGRLESEAEYAARVRAELDACAAAIAARLGHRPTALAWPWGKSTPAGVRAAHDAGYTLLFDTAVGANPPGSGGEHIHRFKVKDEGPGWLNLRLVLYSRPFMANLYARLHG